MEFVHHTSIPIEKRTNMLWITKTLAENPTLTKKLIIDLCDRNILTKDLTARWYFANRCDRATLFMMWYVSLLETTGKDQSAVLMCTKCLISETIFKCLATG